MKSISLSLILILTTCGLCAQSKTYPYQNANLSIEERAQDLLPRMSLEEKVRQMDMYRGENFKTDEAFGGSSFFSNWLGYEGNDMEVVIDLGEIQDISHIETTFLKVTNHIVFFPEEVVFSISSNNKDFVSMAHLFNARPLQPNSKVNDIQLFQATFKTTMARYVKVKAINVKKAPFWHHAAGLPVWVFADEVIVN